MKVLPSVSFIRIITVKRQRRIYSTREILFISSGHSRKGILFHCKNCDIFLTYDVRSTRDDGAVNITSDALIGALRRNFGGIPHEDFIELARMFFEKLKMNISADVLEEDCTITCIRDAISIGMFFILNHIVLFT